MSDSSNSTQFSRAIGLFDAANAQDPNLDEGQPKELLYAKRMTAMLERFCPGASEVVQLAVRAQHIQRWIVPRSSYAMTKAGYYNWRTGLYTFHAETAGELMREAGYADTVIERVKAVIAKRDIKGDAETQLMEDVVNLVFIENYLLPFAGSKPDYDEAKWLGIIRKTWGKMSSNARHYSLSGGIHLPEALLELIQKAIQPASDQ